MPRLDASRTLDTRSREAGRPARAPGLVLTVLAHPDARRVGEQAALGADGNDFSVHRRAPAFSSPLGDPRPLESLHVSRQPVLVLAREGGGASLRAGGEKPMVADGVRAFEHDLDESRLEAGVVLQLSRHVVLLLRRGDPSPDTGALGLVGPSPELAALRAAIRRLAPTEHAVLLRGPTGTGKERVAEALHALSRRAARRLVAVNLAAIPATTAPSQLFGHARGAFTGAAGPHEGYFGEAEGGTLFLDEVGEASVEVQGMLLRALESHEVQVVGGATRRVDVRVVAATDARLEELVAGEQFRAALLHRLQAATLVLPPLARRREDIAAQLVHFLREELGDDRLLATPDDDTTPWLGADVMLACLAHAWPGNSRELRAVARSLAVHCADRPEAEVPPSLRTSPPARATHPTPSNPPLDEARVRTALETAGQRVEVAARMLGVARNTLRARMRELGIRRASELTDEEIAAAVVAVGDDPDELAKFLGVGLHALRLRRTATGR